MRGGLGFLAPAWAPLNLGSALVFASDPRDPNSAINDGTGKCSQLRHIYDPTKYLQSPSGNRPPINAAGGADGKQRVLTLGVGNYLRAAGASFITSLWDGPFASTSGTIIHACSMNSNSGAWCEPIVWVNANPNNAWLHLHDRGPNTMWFRCHDTAGTEGLAVDSADNIQGWCLLTAIKSGANLTLRVNGVQQGTATYGGSGSFTGFDLLMNATFVNGTLISDSSGDTNTVAMAGSIIANTVLSGDQLANAEAWVKRTAGL